MPVIKIRKAFGLKLYSLVMAIWSYAWVKPLGIRSPVNYAAVHTVVHRFSEDVVRTIFVGNVCEPDWMDSRMQLSEFAQRRKAIVQLKMDHC